ncbi:MAG: cytochrome c biogenesis heme-transporting ATPase CcmA [Burkholderiales bacterium]|jgi:heme exporter protein A|nr:cytochrome c biogenesis heme-transporting ATPase CcmA [Burkholderiales bacterium]
MLEVKNLAARRGYATLFEEVGFRVDAGDALLITGANGTGKTTLLRMIAGLSHPAAGQIFWNGKPVLPFAGELRNNVLFTGHAPMIKDELTAAENLTLLLKLADIPVTQHAVLDALAKVALHHRRDVSARHLSQGQRRRIGLARLLLSHALLWVLDEPVTALDTAGIDLLTQMIESHRQQGGAIIASTHQSLILKIAREFAFA